MPSGPGLLTPHPLPPSEVESRYPPARAPHEPVRGPEHGETKRPEERLRCGVRLVHLGLDGRGARLARGELHEAPPDAAPPELRRDEDVEEDEPVAIQPREERSREALPLERRPDRHPRDPLVARQALELLLERRDAEVGLADAEERIVKGPAHEFLPLAFDVNQSHAPELDVLHGSSLREST